MAKKTITGKYRHLRLDWSDRTIRGFTYVLVSLFAIACIIPFWLIISSSFSDESAIRRTGFALWPPEISLRSYNMILKNPDLLIGSYVVTILLTAIGTIIGLFIISMTGYALQRRDFQLRNKISFFIYFTSLFTAGLVPFYYVIVKIYGLKDSYFAVLLPLLMNPWLIILMKNFVKAIPHEITESGKIDGAGDFTIFYQLIVPSMTPALATIGLFVALGYWNEWYLSSLFLTTIVKYRPLQYHLYAQWTNHGFMYRGDWAIAAGLENGEINGWDDLGVYFQYVKDTYPDVVPWDADGSGSSYSPQVAGGYMTDKEGLLSIEGLPVALFYGTKDAPYTLSRAFLEGDTLVNFAIQQKAWAEAGYWREDVLNYTGDQKDLLETGLSGTYQHHTQTWRTERTKMATKQPGSDLRFYWFGKESGALVSLNITHGAMAVAGQSKNPERALMVYDLIRNDKTFYDLFNYGIEGEQYIIKDGFLARPDTYKDDTTDGISFDYWWGRNDDLEIRSSEVDWTAYDALLTNEYDPVKVDYPYGKVVFDTDPISIELDNVTNVYNTYMPVITFGKMENPAAYVAEFRQALQDAGIEKVMAEVQSQIDAVYSK